MTATIRLATLHDAPGVQAIYAPVVRETAISFELEPPTMGDMERRIGEVVERMPWLVCEHRGEVLRYAYASPHRARAAYQWAVDVSVYIDARARRSGVGWGLYRSLHESLGFEPVGVYRAVGYKLGAWHDVSWWQLTLQAHVSPPNPPMPLRTARESAAWHMALATGLPDLRFS